MKFTVEPEPLIRLIGAGNEATRPNVQLQACEGQVRTSEGGSGVVEAMVWEDGRCTLARERILGLLRTYRFAPNVTIEADTQCLRLAGSSIPVIACTPWVSSFDASLGDFATD